MCCAKKIACVENNFETLKLSKRICIYLFKRMISKIFYSKCFRPATTVKRVSSLRYMGTRVTIDQAKAMAREYDEMPNDVLLAMAASGDQEAKEERLIREIMAVDNVTVRHITLKPIFNKFKSSFSNIK